MSSLEILNHSQHESVHRVTERGKPGFQLRKGEAGLSVFDATKVGEEEIRPHFREDSEIRTRTIREIKEKGLRVVSTLGDSGLPKILQETHMEIVPGSGMTRRQFKNALKQLE